MSDFQGYWRIKAFGHTPTVPNGEKVYPRVKETHSTKCAKWETKHDTLLHDCRAHLVKHHNQTYDYEAAILDRGLESTLATLRLLHLKSSEPQIPGTEKLLFVVGKRGKGRGEFEWPRDIAVNPIDGDVFIADAMNHRIQVFNNHGIWKKTIGAIDAKIIDKRLEGEELEERAELDPSRKTMTQLQIELTQPTPADASLIEPLTSQQLYSPTTAETKSGQKLGINDENPEALLNRPMGVAVSPVDGRLYIADSENFAVKIFSSSSSSSSSRFKGAIYLSQGSKPVSVDVDVAGNVICLSTSPVKAIEIFTLTPSEDGVEPLRGDTLRRFKICRQHRSAECDCSPRFVAAPPSVPQKLELFVTDVSKDFVRVFNYDGELLRRISLDDPRTGLALAVSGICFVAKKDNEEEGETTDSKREAETSISLYHHPHHDIVVVDELNHVVHRFDGNKGGSSLETLLLPTDELGAATAISTTPEGHLAVVESGANTDHCFKVFRHRICECHQIIDKTKSDDDVQ